MDTPTGMYACMEARLQGCTPAWMQVVEQRLERAAEAVERRLERAAEESSGLTSHSRSAGIPTRAPSLALARPQKNHSPVPLYNVPAVQAKPAALGAVLKVQP